MAGLDTTDGPSYAWDMEVHFTPEQEARLSQLEDAEFRAGVRRGLAQADRGELMEHEEVRARIERLLKSR